MYKYSELKAVHLEITSKCNASCPMCLRNVCGGALNPRLPIEELSLPDLKSIFPAPFIRQLSRLYMCGNYGDPMAARDTLKAFQFFRKASPSIHLSMFTNGSGRPASWWKDLAKTVDLVHFSIDGLADTNRIYRRGTSFQKIMESAESYIAAGGRAVWDYIVFRHNEHQAEEARRLARKMGFHRFCLKKTGRFFSNQKLKGKSRHPALDKKGRLEYFLEMPKNPAYQNPSLKREAALAEKYGSLREHLNQTPIKCRAAAESSVYISAGGLVFPCCWTANQLYPWYFKERTGQVWDLISRLPQRERSLSAKQRSLREIIEGGFFQKLIPEAWREGSVQESPGRGGRLKVCAKTCGRDWTPFADQFS